MSACSKGVHGQIKSLSFSNSGGLDIGAFREELDEYWDVLHGREDSPVDSGISTLMEVAEAYHSRASEITAMIQRAEASGTVSRSGELYKFRTGELRTFTEAVKKTVELGSRRITLARSEYLQED